MLFFGNNLAFPLPRDTLLSDAADCGASQTEVTPRKLRKGQEHYDGFIPLLDPDEMYELDTTGFCLRCGSDMDGVEPDARGYTCERCGKNSVYGIAELAMMGLVKIQTEEE